MRKEDPAKFSCPQCGSEAYLALIEPIKEAGMQDYRLDQREDPADSSSSAMFFRSSPNNRNTSG
jgi:hypothetical protein